MIGLLSRRTQTLHGEVVQCDPIRSAAGTKPPRVEVSAEGFTLTGFTGADAAEVIHALRDMPLICLGAADGHVHRQPIANHEFGVMPCGGPP